MSELDRYKLSSPPFSWHSTVMDAQQRQARQRFKNDSKRAAVELWRAGVPLATIRKQLKMSAVEGGHPPGLGSEDSGGGVPAEPGAVHASKDPGGDRQGWWHDEILI